MAAIGGRRAFGALVVGLTLVTAGCDSPTEGNATVSKDPADLFVPCEGISDDVVRQAGADPATEESGIAGVHQTGMEICGWTAPWYFISVFSWGHTLDDLRSNTKYVEFEDAKVAGRVAMKFREASDTRRERCDVALASQQGSISVNIDKMSTQPNPEDPCTTARRVAEALSAELPK